MKKDEQPSRPLTVLVVEDNLPSRQYLLFLLKKLNIEAVAAVETGEQALEVMEGKTVDCMLLDIALGAGISGLTVMEKFRQQERFGDIPIIAVTACWSGAMNKFMQKGFTDVLPKPYSFQQLEGMLGKYLQLRSSEVDLKTTTG